MTKSAKARSTRWMAIVGGLGSVVTLSIGLFTLRGLMFPSDPLEVSVVSVETLSRPTVRITLRNTTSDPMVLTRAELRFDQAQVKEVSVNASTELKAIPYTWLITSVEAEKKVSEIPLSRRLDGKEPMIVDFVMGFERAHTTFDSQATLYVTYNNGQTADSKPFPLRIVNSAGQYPQYQFPTTDAQLINALRDTQTDYAIRQIIEELARRRVEVASPEVQHHFAATDPGIQSAAATYFTAVRDPSACAGLAKLVTLEDAQVRRAAMAALVAQGDPAIPEVERLADSQNPGIRQVALTMLGDLPGDRSVNRLRHALSDRSTTQSAMGEPVATASVAIRALTKLRASTEGARLVQMLGDPDPGVVSAAIDAVVTMRLRDALPVLRRISSGGNAELRDQAAGAIATLS